MAKKYRVSRNGLTRCPHCARHIFLAEQWKETDCKFCDAHLIAGRPPVEPVALNRIRQGRSGLIAAGLLSLSLGATGCVEDKEPAPTDQGVSADASMTDAAMMRADRILDQPVYGAVGPDLGIDAAPDPGPQPEYGAPPVGDMGVEPADAQLDMAPDAGSQPEYGAPPADDAGPEPADAQLDMAPDPGPQPEYGAPPEDNE